METEQELNAKILEITMVIQEKYPELSKYLGEMPAAIADEKKPGIKSLKEYYDSLNALLQKYILGHTPVAK